MAGREYRFKIVADSRSRVRGEAVIAAKDNLVATLATDLSERSSA